MTSASKFLAFSLTLLMASATNNLAHAQSTETKELLKVESSNEEEEEKNDTTQMACCHEKGKAISYFIYADGGISDVAGTVLKNTRHAMGGTWALGANVAYKLNPSCDHQLSWAISLGAEIRNFNAISKVTDRFGGKAYDNLHYWYAGIPLMINVMTNESYCDRDCNWGFYAQGGIIAGIKVYNNNYYSAQGEQKDYDLTSRYKSVIFQPVLSAGLLYHAPAATFMVGPYATYTIDNIIDRDNIEEKVLSYGLRFTTFFNR